MTKMRQYFAKMLHEIIKSLIVAHKNEILEKRIAASFKVGLHENNCKWSGVEASVAKLKQVEQSGAEVKGCLHEIFDQVEQSGAERS